MSGTMISVELEKSHNKLRRTLDELSYNHSLGFDSVPLVEKLLKDLISTSEGFRKLKTMYDGAKADLESEKQVCLPLRNENMKLMKENNELHRDMIKLKEEMDSKGIKLSHTISRLETEKEEMKFLLKQKDVHIRNIENEAEGLRAKMNETLHKLHGDQSKMGLSNAEKLLKHTHSKSVNLLGRKTEMEMTKGLDQNNFFEKMLQESRIDKEEWAKDLKNADERALKFREQIKVGEAEKTEMQERIVFLEKQLNIRDLEIRRVHDNYYLPDNLDAIKVKHQVDSFKNQSLKLNSQIDFLNKENKKLEEFVKSSDPQYRDGEVKKLNKEVSKLKSEKENLCKKLETFEKNYSSMNEIRQQNEEKAQFDKFKDENVFLNNQLQNMKEELMKSVKKQQESSSLYNSEKHAISKSVGQLREELIEKQREITRQNDAMSSIQKENDQLKSEINIIKGRELIVGKEIETKAGNIDKIYKEYNAQINENKNLRMKGLDLEQNILNLTKDNKDLLLTRDNLTAQNEDLETKVQIFEEENARSKYQIDNSVTINQKLENQIKILESKQRLLETDNINLNQIVDSKSLSLRELESKCDSFMNQVQNANDTISNLQLEYKSLSKEMTDLLSKNRRLEEKVKSCEKEFSENKYIKEKLSDYEESQRSLKSDKQNVERDNKILRSKIVELTERIEEGKDDLNRSNKEIDTLREEKKKLIGQLELNSKDLVNLEENCLNNQELVTKINELKQSLVEAEKRGESFKEELEKVKSEKHLADFELKKKQLEGSKHQDLVSAVRLELNVAKEENKCLNSQLEKLKDDLVSIRLNDNNTNALHNFENLERIKAEKDRADKLSYENMKLNQKIQGLSQDKDSLNQKILNITKLLSETDITRGEMLTKLQSEINKAVSLENENMIVKDRERNMQKEIDILKEENGQLKIGLNAIDHNYDNLNSDLDFKTQEIARLQIQLKNIQESNEDLNKKLHLQLNRVTVDSKRLNDREGELRELKILVTQLESHNVNLNSQVNQKTKEIQDLNYDLRCLSSENQSLIEDLNRVGKEHEKLSLVKTQIEKNSELIAQKYRSNELDLNDLYNSYKDVCKENERLKQNLKLFVDENREAANYIKSLESNINNYTNNISSAMVEKEALIKRIEFLERYKSELTDQIASLKHELEIKDSKTELLKRNVGMDKDINQNYENHIVNLQKQISKIEGEKRLLQETLNKIENQKEFLNYNNNRSEENVREYENILSDERKRMHNMTQSNNHLRDEINTLRDENKKVLRMLNESKTFNRVKSNMSETITSEDDNGILKLLVNDLQSQLFSLQNDLKTVREEKERLLSEKSLRDVGFSSERHNISSSPSVSSVSLSNK